MRSIKRLLVSAFLALMFAAAAAAGWWIADPGATPEQTQEDVLSDFQPSERLPADSAVAFPTDI